MDKFTLVCKCGQVIWKSIEMGNFSCKKCNKKYKVIYNQKKHKYQILEVKK